MHAAPAQAQRVFVSATGSDGNPCTFASPCRTFQHAHDTAPSGGEIDVLDPAGYGAVTITKSISIQGHGFSGISVGSGANGITINGAATDNINLNGLLIDGAGVGQNGIRSNSGNSLTVENCVVRNFTNSGLQFLSTTSAAQTLTLSNSYFFNGHLDGILIDAQSSGPVSASIDRTVLSGNGTGLGVSGLSGTARIFVAVTDSVAANNSGPGLAAVDNGSSVASIAVSHSTMIGNTFGVLADGEFAAISLAESTLTGNSTGRFEAMNGAFVFSYGNNFTAFNGAGDVGSLTPVSTQ
jgi:hypothetical protein